MYVSICVCAYHVYRCLWNPGEGIRSPEASITPAVTTAQMLEMMAEPSNLCPCALCLLSALLALDNH